MQHKTDRTYIHVIKPPLRYVITYKFQNGLRTRIDKIRIYTQTN